MSIEMRRNDELMPSLVANWKAHWTALLEENKAAALDNGMLLHFTGLIAGLVKHGGALASFWESMTRYKSDRPYTGQALSQVKSSRVRNTSRK